MINAALLDDGPEWPWQNVWIGATITNQEEANRDIPKLLDTPARVRFLSMEPLLGPVDLTRLHSPDPESRSTAFIDALRGGVHGIVPTTGERSRIAHHPLERIDWVIVGGESGPNARPMHPDWARSLRDQCAVAVAPFLFKQWGEWLPVHATGTAIPGCGATPTREPAFRFEHGHHFTKVGKKAAGRLLDGVLHDGFPEVRR